jgi:hypothetical protein
MVDYSIAMPIFKYGGELLINMWSLLVFSLGLNASYYISMTIATMSLVAISRVIK